MMNEKKIRMGHRLWSVDYQKEVLKEIEKSRDSHDGTIRKRLEKFRKFLDGTIRKRLELNK